MTKTTQKQIFALGLLAVAAVAFSALMFAESTLPLLPTAGTGLFCLGAAFALSDQELLVTKALPAGASSINTDGIDLGNSANGDFRAPCELLITAPALAVGQLANASTMTYIVQHDTDPAFGTAATLLTNVIVQTGAGGAGAAGATAQVALPSNVNRYIRVRVTNSAAADASAASVQAELKF